MTECVTRKDVEEQVQHSVALMDSQGAVRSTIREIVQYASGTREAAVKLSEEQFKKHCLTNKRDTARAVQEGEERGSVLLDLCCDRAHTAVLLADITNALDGQCALDPDAACTFSSSDLNHVLCCRQWNCHSQQPLWQVGSTGLAMDDGCCETVAELMKHYDSLVAENNHLREQVAYMTKTRGEVKERCTKYIKELNAQIASLRNELDEQRNESNKTQETHREQMIQQQQLHAAMKEQLQEECAALQKQLADSTARLHAQIDHDQAARTQQEEELRIVRALQEREEALLQAVSELKSQAEQGIVPVAEETKLDQARMHDALKQAEVARNEQATALQALQTEVSAVHKKLSDSMEQTAAQKSHVASLQEQLKQAQADLCAAKTTDAGAATAAEQQRLFAEQQRWISEELKGLVGTVRNSTAPHSDAPPQHSEGVEVPSAPEKLPGGVSAHGVSPQQHSSQLFLSDEEPAKIDAVYRSVGRLAEALRGDADCPSKNASQSQQQLSDRKRGCETDQQQNSKIKQTETRSARKRKGKRKRSDRQLDELGSPTEKYEGRAQSGGTLCDAEYEMQPAAKSAEVPDDSQGEKRVHEDQGPTEESRGKKKACSGLASMSPSHAEPAPLAIGRRRSSRAAAAGAKLHDVAHAATDGHEQHSQDGGDFRFGMPAAGEHGSPPVPFGRAAAASQAGKRRSAAFDVWEDPTSVSPLPPTLRHDGAQVGLPAVLEDASNRGPHTEAAASAAPDFRASAKKPSAAVRAKKDPSAFGIVRNPSAAITSKVLQAAAASRKNFSTFSWADKLAATASERAQQRKGQFTKKRGPQMARAGKMEQPPVKDLFPGGVRLASVRR